MMAITVYSLLWVMQDLYHQLYGGAHRRTSFPDYASLDSACFSSTRLQRIISSTENEQQPEALLML